MTPVWLHRITVLLAACTFTLIVAGGVTVSKQAQSGLPPEHLILSVLTAILTLASAGGLYLYDARPWLKRLGVLAVILVAALALPAAGSSPVSGVLHACAAHAFLALAMVLAVATSRSWQGSPLTIPDAGWPSLRALAWVTPAVVLLQIALGAAYRHHLFGAIPHIVWAFAAAIVIMMFATFVITLSQANPPMRHTAIWLLALVSVQILLGIAAFIMRLNSQGPSDAGMLAATVAHTATGSLVLGCTALLSAQILRNVVPSGAGRTSSPELLSSGRPS